MSTNDPQNTLLSQDAFPVLPLRRGLLFPGRTVTITIGRPRSIALIDAVGVGGLIGVGVQRSAEVDDPGPSDLHPIGVMARVIQVVKKRRVYQAVLEGMWRFRFTGDWQREPFWRATGERVEETAVDQDTALALAQRLSEKLRALAATPNSAFASVSWPSPDTPERFADGVTAALNLPFEKELQVLFTLDVVERLKLVARFVGETQTMNALRGEIDDEVRKGLGKGQRDALLREQMRAIQKALGEDDEEDESGVLREKIESLVLPEDVRKAVDRDLKRYLALNPNQAEHSVLRNYLEWIAALPWSERAEANEDIDRVAQQLDADHAGLDEVKKRILEHMAVLKIAGSNRGAILCLAGPPGVGKTSLGQSIADATNRPFIRLSLGGIRDEADIRGHRRTYVGALPGRLIAAMRKAGAKNPVILLDEVDKLARGGWSGDPQAALLEVLDPEQNSTFTDHYLGQPFDLSEVLFICTVNNLEELSPPLRDRLEVIKIAGYTPAEKIEIARQHLLPDQLDLHALTPENLSASDDALEAIITDYTREAGVRQLKRELQKICRGVTLEVARRPDEAAHVTLTSENIAGYLGKQKFFNDIAERTAIPGVATGLAWTPVGGDILFIETTAMPGKGRLEITGQLGDVMKESARAALAYVRTHAEELGVDDDFLEHHDLHIHVPAGAVPKDGPSAGVTIFTALTSLMTGRTVRADTAMTGECTLRGRVLPVGGVKEKVLAAHRAGITRIILPERNRRDLDELPEELLETTTFFFAREMSQVLDAALSDPLVLGSGGPATAPSSETPEPIPVA